MNISIVIPTRNRARLLERTLREFAGCIESSRNRDSFEILCVDNFSKDDTAEVGQKLANEFPKIKFYRQLEERDTAESSAFNAAQFATGEYVWLFGDDDFPHPDCLDRLYAALTAHQPDFALLNMRLLVDSKKLDYIRADRDIIAFPTGRALFEKFGFVSATTTLSCLCYRKSLFKMDVFETLRKESEIYSHSFSFFACYHDRPAIFIAAPLLDYTQNTLEQETSRFAVYTEKNKRSPYDPFIYGLLRLVKATSRITGIHASGLLQAQEIEMSKSTWQVKHSVLWCFIVRMIMSNHRAGHIIIESEIDTLFANAPAPIVSLIQDVIPLLHDGVKSETALASLERILNTYEANFFTQLHSSNPSAFLYFNPRCAPVGIDAQSVIQRPSLTVLIPSYGRAAILDANLNHIHTTGIYKVSGVDFLVAINLDAQSESEYLDLEEKWSKRIPNLRLHFHTSYVATAEESINRSIHLCTGDYIHLLGDDDTIIPKAFECLISFVRGNEWDAIIFNSVNLCNHHAYSADPHYFTGEHPFGEPFQEMTYETMVVRYGLTTAMAFISRYTFRRSVFSDFSDIIAISPVYSHVFAFLRMLHGRKCLLSDYPLILRGDSKVEKRLIEFTQKSLVKRYHPWTDGLFALFKHADENGYASMSILADITEIPNPKVSYKLWHEIFNQYCRQMKLDVEALAEGTPDQYLAHNGFDEFLVAVARFNPINSFDRDPLLFITAAELALKIRSQKTLGEMQLHDLKSKIAGLIDLNCRYIPSQHSVDIQLQHHTHKSAGQSYYEDKLLRMQKSFSWRVTSPLRVIEWFFTSATPTSQNHSDNPSGQNCSSHERKVYCMQSSLSWKITGPLRAIRRTITTLKRVST